MDLAVVAIPLYCSLEPFDGARGPPLSFILNLSLQPSRAFLKPPETRSGYGPPSSLVE